MEYKRTSKRFLTKMTMGMVSNDGFLRWVDSKLQLGQTLLIDY